MREYDISPEEVRTTVAVALAWILVVVVILLALSGCSTTCPPCSPVTEVHEVPIEHAVNPCAGITPPPEPTPPPAISDDAQPSEQAAWIARYVAAWKAWAKELEARLRACSEEVE